LPEGQGTRVSRAALYIGFRAGVCFLGAVIGAVMVAASEIKGWPGFFPSVWRPLRRRRGARGLLVHGSGRPEFVLEVLAVGCCAGMVPAAEVATGTGAAGPVLGTGLAVVRRPSRLRRAGAKAKVWILPFCGDLPRPMCRNRTSVLARRGGTYMRPPKPLNGDAEGRCLQWRLELRRRAAAWVCWSWRARVLAVDLVCSMGFVVYRMQCLWPLVSVLGVCTRMYWFSELNI
jgi:hypothetical protein